MGFPRLCTRNQSFSVGLFLFNAQALPEERGKSELFPITSQKRPSLTAKRGEWRMNGLGKQDHHLSPQDPPYYAPGSLRKRSMSPLTPSRETRSELLFSSAFNNPNCRFGGPVERVRARNGSKNDINRRRCPLSCSHRGFGSRGAVSRHGGT
jgi:hypothetical protein